MHTAALEWVSEHAPAWPVTVIDIGGRDVNGTVRHLFNAAAYTSVDLFPGPSVDIVADFCDVVLEPVDVVICCEVAEHTWNWPKIVARAAGTLRPGGLFIFTAAGPTRTPHSALDGGPVHDGEWYENIGPDVLDEVLAAHFTRHEIDVTGDDIRAVAWAQEAEA